jgi:GST-like protein
MQLQGREYLCGEYTIADIALYPWTVVLEDMADINLGDYPGLNSWATRVSQRPAAMASV